MDDIQQRLGALESSMSGVRADVSAIKATLPHLATKADLQCEIGGVERRMIQWFVGTAITLVALVSGIVFGIARYLPAPS